MNKHIYFIFILAIIFCSLNATEFVANGTFDITTAWSWARIDGNGGWRSSGGNPGGYFIINEGGAASTDPTLWQTITGLTIGLQYSVSGDFMMAHGSPATNAFGVQIGSNLWEYSITTTSWTSFFETFTATTSTVDLILTGERNGTDTDPGVDNISIQNITPPVPEPATLILLVLSGLLCVVYKRR